jgi:hypothetical protein
MELVNHNCPPTPYVFHKKDCRARATRPGIQEIVNRCANVIRDFRGFGRAAFMTVTKSGTVRLAEIKPGLQGSTVAAWT